MASGALTPRQKMINMMYLVLTAMLALNVSKDILNAFVVVNSSLVVTNKNFDTKVQNSYLIFENALKQNKVKVQEKYDKAMQVKKLSDELIKYIQSKKVQVVVQTDKISETEALKVVDSVAGLKSKDNFDDPTRVFCGTSSAGSEKCLGGAASELKKRIEDYKKNLYDILGADKNKVNLSLVTDGKYYDAYNKEINWEQNNFQNMVLVATLTNLNRIIGEIKNAEFDVVNELFSSVSALDFKFDKLEARVVPKSKIITVGENYEADIFVAAWDSKQAPEIWIGDFDTVTWKPNGTPEKLTSFAAGIGKYIVGAGGVGDHTLTGIIKIPSPTPDGDPRVFRFKEDYKVIPSTSTVSPTKMNVFYVGLDNPVEISVPGTASDKIGASISGGGTIKKVGSGKFIVNVPSGVKNVSIHVSAVTPSGSSKSAGTYPFRVMEIPRPESYIPGVNPMGKTNKSVLIQAGSLMARLVGFVFEGVSFTVTSYTITQAGSAKSITVNGNKFTPEVKALINSTKSNGLLFFDGIKAVGPSGKTTTLTPVSVTIQ